MLIHRTFTRDELTLALAAVDRPDIADGLYSARVEHDQTRYCGPRALALDFDDPGDLAVFIVTVTRLLSPEDAVEFAASTDLCLPGHPADSGPGGARWLRWVLDEPTAEEWADQINDCGACATEDESGRECETHARAPWDRTIVHVREDARDRHLVAVP